MPQAPTASPRLPQRRGWADDDIVVNVQGDEPLLPPALIGQAAALLAATPARVDRDARDADRKRVRLPGPERREGRRPAGRHRALFQSRAGALGPRWLRVECRPAPSATAVHAVTSGSTPIGSRRCGSSRRLRPAALEQRERLEQLRALAMGLSIAVADAVEAPGPGVDTPEDLARVEALLRAGGRA